MNQQLIHKPVEKSPFGTDTQPPLFHYPLPISAKEFRDAMRSVPELLDMKCKRFQTNEKGWQFGVAVSRHFDAMSPLDRVRYMTPLVERFFGKLRAETTMVMYLSNLEEQELLQALRLARAA